MPFGLRDAVDAVDTAMNGISVDESSCRKLMDSGLMVCSSMMMRIIAL